MKLAQKIFSEPFSWLLKLFQANQPLDVFKLTLGVLWVVVINFVDGVGLFHEIFQISVEQTMCVKQSGSDGPFRDS